jgi:N-acyl amino acid synthase of PEP-CTERM/exosortase system
MQEFDQLDLGKGFQRYFEILPAVTPAAREAVYRIRHEVYCEDLGYEPIRADGLEYDEYDAHSLHCLIRTVGPTKRLVGCTRLVIPRAEALHTPLPFETYCAEVLDRSIIDPAQMPRERIAEVSRLAVRGRYRRRRGEQNTPMPIQDQDFEGTDAAPRFPYIPISLYLGSIALAERQGIDTLFVLTEPRLAQHFARFGVNIRQIGSVIEHRGARVPSMINVPELINNLRPLVCPIWDVVRKQIRAGFDSPESGSPGI